jgi:hypothetical protein
MKAMIRFLVFIFCSGVIIANPTYEASIRAAELDPSEANVIELGGHLRGIARYGQPPVNKPYYDLIQKTLLSIPGHAQYFADKLERLRTELPKTDDGHIRSVYIAQTLIHMPSPETIKVLGDYLHDERDVPPQRKWTPENAHLAAYALSRIGLRDFPFEGPLAPYSLTIWPDLHQLPDYRAWWEEVKSGQRAFSFKGQAVEYRFRPDGTWETIPIANPPDDGPKPVPAATDSGKRDESPVTVDSVKPADRSLLWWIAGVAGVLLAVALALFRKFRRAG